MKDKTFNILMYGIIIVVVVSIVFVGLKVKQKIDQPTPEQQIAEKNFWTLVLCNQYDGRMTMNESGYDLCSINKTDYRSHWKNQWVLIQEVRE